jgi:hypothetical protein
MRVDLKAAVAKLLMTPGSTELSYRVREVTERP